MTNLYDFLRAIRDTARASGGTIHLIDEERAWLEQFLKSPDVELHFKAFDTGQRVDGEPVMAQNYSIAGQEVDIFCLVSEAALMNPQFQKVIRRVVEFIDEHVPTCPACQAQHNEGQNCPPPTGWGFPTN